MLRIDRTTLPTLPRPVFEIQAEPTRDGDIRVAVLAGQRFNSQIEEFPLVEQSLLEHHLLGWLSELPYVEVEHARWKSVVRRIALTIADWARQLDEQDR